MIKKFIIIFFILIYLISCSSSNRKESTYSEKITENPEEIYFEAKRLFDLEEFSLADEEFSKLQKLYPLSNEAIQSEFMSAFIDYIIMDYDNSIFKFNKIIRKYPSHQELDYAYYMIAMNNYEQINHHELDGKFNEMALEAFNQVILRFPESKYAKDSIQKTILIKSNKAAKHMEIGRFYLNEKKYTAALNRFKIVIDEYSMTKFTPEALHRMVEAYYEMGLIDESKKTAAVLGYNYPDSEWYGYSYKLIKKIEKKTSIFNKVKNIFN